MPKKELYKYSGKILSLFTLIIATAWFVLAGRILSSTSANRPNVPAIVNKISPEWSIERFRIKLVVLLIYENFSLLNEWFSRIDSTFIKLIPLLVKFFPKVVGVVPFVINLHNSDKGVNLKEWKFGLLITRWLNIIFACCSKLLFISPPPH